MLLAQRRSMLAEHEATPKPLHEVTSRREPSLLIPREHGAYAELLFPMAAVFLGGAPTRATWLLAAAVLAIFIANEPLLVLSGQRGARMQREQTPQARGTLIVAGLAAVACGLLGVWLAPVPARIALILPWVLGGSLLWIGTQGFERRLGGEALAAAALSSVALPLGLTAELGVGAASAVASIWLLASLLGTSVVRLAVAGSRAKTEAEVFTVRNKWALLFLLSLALVAVGAAALFAPKGPLVVLAAVLPVALTATAFSIAKPSARSLRLVGWGLVFANFSTLAGVVVVLRIVTDFKAIESTLPFPIF